VLIPKQLSQSRSLSSRNAWLLASIAFLMFLALSIGYSLTRAPWWDEGVFADVAMNFRDHGYLGSSVLDPYSYLELPQAQRYTFWQFPLYLVTLGSWFHLVPATPEYMRILSVIWGCLYIACWFLFVRSLSRNETLALFVASVVALNYTLIAAASNGRMDMMCAALGLAGLASYSCFRESNWPRAVILASVFGAAALFCHPMGVLMNVSIAALVAFDWRQARLRPLLWAGLLYLTGGALCVLYILRAPPGVFSAQIAASSYRVAGIAAALRNVLNDGYQRYVIFYWTILSGVNKLKVATLIFPVAGVIGAAADRNLRSRPLVKRLSGPQPAQSGFSSIRERKLWAGCWYMAYLPPPFSPQ